MKFIHDPWFTGARYSILQWSISRIPIKSVSYAKSNIVILYMIFQLIYEATASLDYSIFNY